MSTEILVKDLRERSLPVAALSIGIGILTIGALGVYSGMSDTLDDLTKDFPEELMSFMGGDAPGGYVVGEVFNLIAPLALVGFAVMTGAAATAGEEERKTLGMVMGTPVSRTSVLVGKAVALLVALGVATGGFLLAASSATAWFDVGLSTGNVVATAVHLGSLALVFGAVAMAAGAVTGRASVAAGVAGGIAVASYLANSMLPLADLDGWAEVSPWFYYAGSEPLVNGFDPTHFLVLCGLAAAAFAVALVAFNRRDLKG